MWQDSIQRILDAAVRNHEAAGISTLIRHGEEEPVYIASGWADLAAKKPIARDSIFRLYSQTKPVTAAA